MIVFSITRWLLSDIVIYLRYLDWNDIRSWYSESRRTFPYLLIKWTCSQSISEEVLVRTCLIASVISVVLRRADGRSWSSDVRETRIESINFLDSFAWSSWVGRWATKGSNDTTTVNPKFVNNIPWTLCDGATFFFSHFSIAMRRQQLSERWKNAWRSFSYASRDYRSCHLGCTSLLSFKILKCYTRNDAVTDWFRECDTELLWVPKEATKFMVALAIFFTNTFCLSLKSVSWYKSSNFLRDSKLSATFQALVRFQFDCFDNLRISDCFSTHFQYICLCD